MQPYKGRYIFLNFYKSDVSTIKSNNIMQLEKSALSSSYVDKHDDKAICNYGICL